MSLKLAWWACLLGLWSAQCQDAAAVPLTVGDLKRLSTFLRAVYDDGRSSAVSNYELYDDWSAAAAGGGDDGASYDDDEAPAAPADADDANGDGDSAAAHFANKRLLAMRMGKRFAPSGAGALRGAWWSRAAAEDGSMASSGDALLDGAFEHAAEKKQKFNMLRIG